MKTGKPGAQTDQTRTTVEITTAALEDVVGIQDVLYRTWLATYPSETFGINVDDIEEMYKDRNSEETLAKGREQVSRPQETTLVAKEKDKVVGLCRIIKREDKSVMEAIYILPEYQRLGIGSSVWREAQKLLDPKKMSSYKWLPTTQMRLNFTSDVAFAIRESDGRRKSLG